MLVCLCSIFCSTRNWRLFEGNFVITWAIFRIWWYLFVRIMRSIYNIILFWKCGFSAMFSYDSVCCVQFVPVKEFYNSWGIKDQLAMSSECISERLLSWFGCFRDLHTVKVYYFVVFKLRGIWVFGVRTRVLNCLALKLSLP